MLNNFELELGWWVLIPAILIYIIGVWLGNTKRIIVYRNYTDVMIVGLLVILPTAVLGIILLVTHGEKSAGVDHQYSFYLLLALASALALVFIIICVKTFRDNPNPLKALLALYVKIPTGIMFFFHFAGIFRNGNRKARRNSLFWTLILTPLLYGLIADTSGSSKLSRRLNKR
ncbi:hypothetical protein J6I90_06540 [Pseudidiomarina sp. 1APP75-32.1]|uniref:Uncharacterized protein n=1 Tax=Pseudidiomarina terrestris TaxID=2820060 RepID=A0AAW7R1X7_9GAMM|nr:MULTISPECIES: hypothetical protein [unclassified Pseudidiomarina]MDN7124534.1 hypothetical protein [Pseudidiomarina sp. 1APP75-32.1]MDN7129175.1 hypothetical protein [Pseudidiomarina sp. 1APR75-15]